MLEQFLDTLPVELRVWLCERKPTTVATASSMADDYRAAHRRKRFEGSKSEIKKDHPSKEAKQEGPEKEAKKTPPSADAAQTKERNRDRTERRCFNCHERGHMARNCPHALYCGVLGSKGAGDRDVVGQEVVGGAVEQGSGGSGCGGVVQGGTGSVGDGDGGGSEEVVRGGQGDGSGSKEVVGGIETRVLWGCVEVQESVGVGSGRPTTATRTIDEPVTCRGIVEGTVVEDIVLDTGCACTMIHSNLVPEEKLVPGATISLRCAHGDVETYPLAAVTLEVEGLSLPVTAAVAQKLPVSVLLGTDVPELGDLLNSHSTSHHNTLVMTRAQARSQAEAVVQAQQRQDQSEVCPNPVDNPPPLSTLDDDLFSASRERPSLTRREKRKERHHHGLERAKDRPKPQTTVTTGVGVTREHLQQLQDTDETLADAREQADQPSKPFVREDGLLFHKRELRKLHGESETETVMQLVLPRSCRQRVLELAHSIPLAGHLGRKKTYARLAQRFYWPSMSRDVVEYVRSCEACQKCGRRRPARVPMIPLPVVDVPFSRVAMDLVGPLPRSRSGNRYVLVLCDYATRYPEAVPLRNIDAETIAEELIQIFARVGLPQEILTDQGSNFQSQLLQQLHRFLKVHAIRTSPYHPQTDGLVERFNQTLKSMLRKCAREEGKDWDKMIPFLLFAYREVPQESTGFSPFELVYGRDVRGPLDVVREAWVSNKRTGQDILSYVLLMRDRMTAMTDHVKVNLKAAGIRQKKWYDHNSRERSFCAGDQVLVLLPSSTSKLTAQWQGPYQVLSRVGDVNYLVYMPDHKKKKRILHVNMLQGWHQPSPSVLLAQTTTEALDQEEVPTWNDPDEGHVRMGKHLSHEQVLELQSLIDTYCNVFRTLPGHTSVTEHRIVTGAVRPVRLAPYRIPQALQGQVRQELDEMLAHGIIERSTSDWASPLVIVRKKDSTLRLCVDYRRLNSESKMDAYPIPRVDDLIDQVSRAPYITTLDLTKGYWQVPVAVEDREKTAFTTPFGLFQFTRMPFGLKGAPATFQRMVDRLLDGLEFASAYIDDVIVFSRTWNEHLRHLRVVMEKLQRAGLTVRRKKCQFGMAECSYLGHVVGSGRVCPEAAKIQAVRSFEQPVTKSGVRSFLGLAGYYRKFVPDYAAIAAPLTDLTRKSKPSHVVWTPECDDAFNQLKDSLCSSPVLKSPEWDKTFVLQTDASGRGVGAVLSQAGEDGSDRPVVYFSRKLLPREEKYSTTEKECLAIKLGVQAFHVYLIGRSFVIQTDHRSLEWLDRMKSSNARLARWSLMLQSYDFRIEYRAGHKNGNADGLSRQWDGQHQP